jgi:hypothetical protein
MEHIKHISLSMEVLRNTSSHHFSRKDTSQAPHILKAIGEEVKNSRGGGPHWGRGATLGGVKGQGRMDAEGGVERG